MSSTDLSTFQHFNGVGTSMSSHNSLPNQAVPDAVKQKKNWKKRNMDALESIGVLQLADNIKFRDLYKMKDGRLAYSDYEPDHQVLNKIHDLADGLGVPTFVKHYDFIGIIVRQLVGEWMEQRDNFKVDSIDEVSDNEFLRERTQRVQEYAFKTFKSELDIQLVKMGLNPEKQDFKSQEEQQQYLQKLEEERAKIIAPEQIEKDMQKNWKTKAAEWAEHVIEKDQKRFYMDKIDKSEMEDYFLTGRFFRNYYIGYDYYEPERWSPIETFFSQDVSAENPQDCEYVGRVFYASTSDIIRRYSHRLKPEEIRALNKRYENTGNANADPKIQSWKQAMDNGMMGNVQTLPHMNYYDYDLGLQIQSALDIPMGETLINTPDGQKMVPNWLAPLQNNQYLGYRYSVLQRDDIIVRKDLLQVTEGYWRSWKRMWFLNWTDENGRTDTEIVTDDLLPEFIEEKGIKKINNKSLTEIQDDLEPNTMYEFFAPEIWFGTKINSGNSFLQDNLYLGVGPLDYQIRGESNIFDVKIPVGGIISDSIAQRLRPYQVGYNICLNQIFNLLEKEIGMFFLFDINFLPAEYKNTGNIDESLEKLRDLAKDVGIVPLDTTKQNMQGANAQMNTFTTQDITFTNQINSRIQLSEYYMKKALEQIGITPPRMGQSGVYETATGIVEGTKASYMQTADIFTNMSVARRKTMELHLAVAQYCQKEYLDTDFVFSSSDGDKHYMHLSDPDFPLRRLGVLPVNDPKKRRDLEQMKQTLLNMNTLGADILSYAELMSSDTIGELISIGRRGRAEQEKTLQAEREHELALEDKKIEALQLVKQADRAFEASENQKDRDNRIDVEELQSYGRAAGNDADMAVYDIINKQAQQALNENKVNAGIQQSERKLALQETESQRKASETAKQLDFKLKDYNLKERTLQNQRYIAEINKN